MKKNFPNKVKKELEASRERWMIHLVARGNPAEADAQKMKIRTKKIRVIEMTEEEIRKFHDLMESARQGHTSHYAEEQLADGTFLGVSVVSNSSENYPKAY